MRSPSGGEARHRGGTHVGKAPPLPEMTISGLTESGLSGMIKSPKVINPGFAGVAARPFRRAVSFLGSCLQRLSANHFAPPRIPHRGRGAVKHVGKMAISRVARLDRSWRWSHESGSLGSGSMSTARVLAYRSHAGFGQSGPAARPRAWH